MQACWRRLHTVLSIDLCSSREIKLLSIWTGFAMKLKFVATGKLIPTVYDWALSFFLSKESTRRRTCRRNLKLLNSQALKLDWIHGKKSKKYPTNEMKKILLALHYLELTSGNCTDSHAPIICFLPRQHWTCTIFELMQTIFNLQGNSWVICAGFEMKLKLCGNRNWYPYYKLDSLSFCFRITKKSVKELLDSLEISNNCTGFKGGRISCGRKERKELGYPTCEGDEVYWALFAERDAVVIWKTKTLRKKKLWKRWQDAEMKVISIVETDAV